MNETYIALLRGINVSGQKMIRMEDLKKALGDLNFIDIRTYIQSGNIVFEHDKTDPGNLAAAIAGVILKHFGFTVPVIVRTRSALGVTFKKNPFLLKTDHDAGKLHVTFLDRIPDPERECKTNEISFLPDEFVISGEEIYLYCPNGYGRTKLTSQFFESKLKVVTTTRNWKTVETLLSY